MSKKFRDLTGLRFGRIYIVKYSHHYKGSIYWLCKCDCGNESIAKGTSLNYGSTKSCGCGSANQAVKNCEKYRNKIRVPSPYSRKLKDLFRNMNDRCYNNKNKRWKNYGGRGIKVCDQWRNNRRGFYSWAIKNGYSPSLQIDRIDVDGNYEPANCRFVDAITQMNNTTYNRFVDWMGQRKTVSEWARQLDVTPSAIAHRLNRGWSLDRVMTQPFRRNNAAARLSK